MRRSAAWMAVACACGCHAQDGAYRADPPSVMAPPAAVAAAAEPDAVVPFEQAYRRAGRPRVVLLWNRVIDDKASETVVDETVSGGRSHRSGRGSERRVQGAAESTVSAQSEGDGDWLRTETRGRRIVDEGSRKTTLTERSAVMLQRGFIAEMNRGGVRFVDRALLMRTTAASGQRNGGDSKALEIVALMRHAELVLEVVLIDDADAPFGQGFDVRVKDLRGGEELVSLYSKAVPTRRPPGNGAWVAGADGYEFQRPPPAPVPGPTESGVALAREVMGALGGSLPRSAGRAPDPRAR